MAGSARQFRLRPWHLLLLGAIAVVIFAWLPGRRAQRGAATHDAAPATRAADNSLRIVCTFLPMYVFTLNVAREVPGVSVELLVSADVGCPHDYSLRAEDARRMADADIVVSNGLGLEPFLDREARPDPGKERSLRLPGGAYLITVSDDCDVIHAGNNRHDAESHEGHDHDSEVNPHVWVSPGEAVKQIQTLTRKLGHFDAQHADRYEQNAATYIARLWELRDRLSAAGRTLKVRNIVTFHDAFAYLARDLNLNVVATLTQDPEHAPAAREIAETVNTIKAAGAAAIFYEPAYPDALARTIARETGVPLYPLNPFNSIEGQPSARSYEEVMEQNLRTLQQALGGTP